MLATVNGLPSPLSKPESEVNPMGLNREASDARPFFLEWVIIIIFTAILQRCRPRWLGRRTQESDVQSHSLAANFPAATCPHLSATGSSSLRLPSKESSVRNKLGRSLGDGKWD
jgi:hypothetical protein